MKIWTSDYTLTPRLASLGGHAKGRERHGVLIKVEYDDGSVGYADVHPWVELGDEPLGLQLQKLANFETTPLTQRSLELAALDAEARRNQTSLFSGLKIPDSHFLITDLKKGFGPELDRALSEGYTTLKIKVGRSVQSLHDDRNVLEKTMGLLQNFKLRFDFNSQRNHEEVRTWIQSLSPALRQAIEFIEDPCPWNLGNWLTLHEASHLPLALDHGSEEIFSTADEPTNPEDMPASDMSRPVVKTLAQLLSYAVVKPAVQDPSRIVNRSLRYVVTSYLDHPVGQMGAALEAGYLAERVKVATCGLLSHHSYEANSYSEAITSKGPVLTPSSGDAGLGFTALLEKENWQDL